MFGAAGAAADHGTGPVVWVEVPFAERVERILSDYVVAQQADFVAVYGEGPGEVAFREHLLGSLAKIAQRLGGERYQRLQAIMQAALASPGRGRCGPAPRVDRGPVARLLRPDVRLPAPEARRAHRVCGWGIGRAGLSARAGLTFRADHLSH